MDCDRARELLSALLDADPTVTAAERTEAESHRDDCAECAAFHDAFERIAACPTPNAPEGFADRVMSTIAAEDDPDVLITRFDAPRDDAGAWDGPSSVRELLGRPPRRHLLPRAVTGLAAAAAVLVAVGVGLSAMRDGVERTSTTTASSESAALDAVQQAPATAQSGSAHTLGTDKAAGGAVPQAPAPEAGGDRGQEDWELLWKDLPDAAQDAYSHDAPADRVRDGGFSAEHRSLSRTCPSTGATGDCIDCHGSAGTWSADSPATAGERTAKAPHDEADLPLDSLYGVDFDGHGIAADLPGSAASPSLPVMYAGLLWRPAAEPVVAAHRVRHAGFALAADGRHVAVLVDDAYPGAIIIARGVRPVVYRPAR